MEVLVMKQYILFFTGLLFLVGCYRYDADPDNLLDPKNSVYKLLQFMQVSTVARSATVSAPSSVTYTGILKKTDDTILVNGYFVEASSGTKTTCGSDGSFSMTLVVGKKSYRIYDSSNQLIDTITIELTSTTATPVVTATYIKITGSTTVVNGGGDTNGDGTTEDPNVAPTGLKYPGTPFVFGTDSAITTVTPTVTGVVTSYTVSPALPEGLRINATTGLLSGTPAKTQAATTYTITATNSYGSTTTTISIKIGDYCYTWGCFTDNMDGTIAFEGAFTYAGKNLTWMKCSQGQTWNSVSNTCFGTALTYRFCSSDTNDCNNGDASKLLGSGFLNGATSTAYNTCDDLNIGAGTFGKTDWRVPTKDELKALIHCTNKTMPAEGSSGGCGSSNYTSPAINNLFPQTVASAYWSSSVYNISYAWLVAFSNGSTLYEVGDYTTWYHNKANNYYVRCVR
jgi:hypothetical protein